MSEALSIVHRSDNREYCIGSLSIVSVILLLLNLLPIHVFVSLSVCFLVCQSVHRHVTHVIGLSVYAWLPVCQSVYCSVFRPINRYVSPSVWLFPSLFPLNKFSHGDQSRCRTAHLATAPITLIMCYIITNIKAYTRCTVLGCLGLLLNLHLSSL